MNDKLFYGILIILKKTAVMSMFFLITMFSSGCDIDPDPDPIPLTEEEKAVKKAGPSVVNIVAQLDNGTSLGSGVIFRNDGYIVTNDHVVKGANSLEVHLFDKRTLKAKLIGRDSRMDLAVIKIEGENLEASVFADSSLVSQANKVIAIGNAEGIENSVTQGIISNVNVYVDDGKNIGYYLQTDSAINPGNSGGALINLRGEIIGIPTKGLKDSDNISYAIPSNDAKRIAEQIVDTGYISYPYLGVNAVNKATPDGTNFIAITGVMDNSPASKAGIKTNDIIYQINDVRVETVSKLRMQLNNSEIGSRVSIHILRQINEDVKDGIIEATLEELPKGYYTIDWS